MKTWKKAVLLILPLAALALCILPGGVRMEFAPSPDTRTVSCYPYLHMLPFGYGHFAPMLTFAFTVIIAVLAAVGIRKNTVRAVIILSVLTFVISVLPAVTGAYTVIGGCITALLAAEFILAAVFAQKEKDAK